MTTQHENQRSEERPKPDDDGTYHVTVAGHEFRVFVELPHLLESMLADIKTATSRIWLESYILANDDVGKRVIAALAERARAGANVRVLYDALGSVSTRSALFSDLLAAGGKVHAYHGFWYALRRLRFFRTLNRRNHRKLLVIDDQVGYFGGMNVVDVGPKSAPSITGSSPAANAERDRGWRDTHMRMQGPQQQDLADSFDRSWRKAHREPLEPRSRGYRRGILATGDESIRFFDSGPGRGYTRAARIYARLIRSATRRITISMAYFVPTGRILRSLLRARKRGTLIRVVMPLASDVRVVDWAAAHLSSRLIKRGFRMFRHGDQMLHSKLTIIDRQWTIVGSCNLDARSMWYNLEFLAVIRSARMAEVAEAICKDDMERSKRLSLRELEKRTPWQHFRDTMAYALRWGL